MEERKSTLRPRRPRALSPAAAAEAARAERIRAALHLDNMARPVQALTTAEARAVAAADTAPGPGGAAALPFRAQVEEARETAEHEAERAAALVHADRCESRRRTREAVTRCYLAARVCMTADGAAESAVEEVRALADALNKRAVAAFDATSEALALAVEEDQADNVAVAHTAAAQVEDLARLVVEHARQAVADIRATRATLAEGLDPDAQATRGRDLAQDHVAEAEDQAQDAAASGDPERLAVLDRLARDLAQGGAETMRGATVAESVRQAVAAPESNGGNGDENAPKS